jgi:transcriptional regulator with XRE-family HTH domain
MTLQDWLSSQEVSDADFADRIGVTRQALYRYKTGQRMPRIGILRKIISETSGKVRAQDFIESQSTTPSEAA